MTKLTSPPPVASTTPLSFTIGKGGATGDDVKRFCSGVNQDAETICDGIVAALQKQGKLANVKQTGGKYVITVGAPQEQSAIEAQAAAPETIATNITVTANTNDLPAVITAFTAFFGNWRAVAGLIATGAAVVGGVLLLGVNRQA